MDYRNGWGVILANFGSSNFEVMQGDRIAQAVLNKVEQITWKEVENLDETERGLGGFGSTGVSENKTPNITAKEILENNIEPKPKNKSKFK